MKKTLLFAALLIGGLSQLSAQCVIVPSCSTGTVGYCSSPAPSTNLPNGTEMVAYSTTIQFSIGTSVLGGAITITDAAITSVTGMPAGFLHNVNPSTATIPAGSDACMFISGPLGPGSAGVYTVTANLDVNTSFGPTSQTVSWALIVDPAGTTNVKSISQVTGLVVSPNPATSELFVSSGSHFGKVFIIDALGKTVLSHDANYAAQTTINISSLSKGVYFLQINDGANVTTKKFIKD